MGDDEGRCREARDAGGGRWKRDEEMQTENEMKEGQRRETGEVRGTRYEGRVCRGRD
jgi:hypothetical protein